MKSRFLTGLSLTLLLPAAAIWHQDAETRSDRDEIRQLVTDTYATVMYEAGPIELLRKGLHSSFGMYVLSNNRVQTRDLETWIARLEQRRAQRQQRQPSASRVEYSLDFEMIDVAGPAAVVKLLARRDGTLQFTDYLTLYKFEEGWRITTKSFAQH